MKRRQVNSGLRPSTLLGAGIADCASVKMFIFIACAFLFFGCGSGGTSALDGPTPAQDIGELSSLEQSIYTEGYAGYLVVHLNPEVRIQNSEAFKSVRAEPFDVAQGKLVEAPNDNIIIPTILQPTITAHPSVTLKRSVSTAPEVLDARKLYLELISGKQLTDFNLIYHVEVSDPDEAVRTMRDLQKTDGVDKVYPKRKGYVTGLSTVPDLTGQQGYLEANDTNGGLNARAAWTAGVRGANMVVVDGEYGWNFDHEDLDLNPPGTGGDMIGAAMCWPVDAGCIGDFAHGTAIAGILASLDNGHGTTGFAPEADLKTSGPGGEALRLLTDGEGDLEHYNEVPPGTIYLIEIQRAGRLSPDGFCFGFSEADQYGCVAIEVDPEEFGYIEQATAAGVTVVEGAGNGSVDLGDSGTYWPYEITLYDHDSGSILVGGSQGSNHQKISFSNFGSPIDAYAWAQGVVTTAYPLGGSSGPYYWTPGAGANPPNDDNNAYYTNRFGGTSSATAMVGGAAVLVQSYAKNLFGHDRYLMPLKMREILVSTGVTQSGSGGNIGKQPRIDRAIAAVDTFWSSATTSYPELLSGGRLTLDEMIALRTIGIGLICKDYDPAGSDPICPDDAMWVPGTRIAKWLDFDGDGRADLVSWTNGQWKVDLSSIGSSGDNYGAWDIVLNYTPTAGRWVWPFVEDYNSDGREDFAVYDKEHGKWYIAFTDSALLGTGTWHGWDWEIDYSSEWIDTLQMDPRNSDYSRPVPGDYNGDGWVDIAIACSDGYWRIDFGGANESDYGTFDQNVRYLSTERLTEAPGWAYLPAPGQHNATSTGKYYIGYKIPDGLPDEGRLVGFSIENPTIDLAEDTPHIFGGNHYVPFVYTYGHGMSLKNSGTWNISDDYLSFEPIPPQGKRYWGILECRPVLADFDGDGREDRAVMCPNEWRIAYTGSSFPMGGDIRTIPLGFDSRKFSLPGRSYSGGINYSFVQQLIAYAQEANPAQPPPIPVDMVNMNVCYLPVEDPAGDCH